VHRAQGTDAGRRELNIIHKVSICNNTGETGGNLPEGSIERAVKKTLAAENVDMVCAVNVLVTGDEGIRDYNRDFRGIDEATDVISFPMQIFKTAGWEGLSDPEFDEDTGDLPLGDIVISSESVKSQAVEYGNTIDHEASYLIIHSTLHLLGYDHDNEVSEKVMHEKCENILYELRGGHKNDQ